MKKKQIFPLFSGVAALALMTLFASCEEEDYTSRMPEFSKLEVDYDAPSVGDSITVTARQSKKGTLFNGTIYKWTVKDSKDSIVHEAEQKVIYDNNPVDPVFGYRIPQQAKAGRYTVYFHARYKYSGQGGVLTGGGLGSSDGSNGNIRPTVSGATYGECKGNVRFEIQPK